MLSWIGIGAIVAAVSVVVGAAATPSAPPTLSAMDQQAPSTTTTPAVKPLATTTAPSTSTPSTSATPTSSPFASDEFGFVGTEARCDSTQYTMAFGRTERSMVAICQSQGGEYEYRGVRLSDGATVTLGDVEAQSDGEYVARADGVTYVVSEQEFYLMSGSEVIREEAWLEFHEPTLAAESEAGPSSSSAPSSSAPSSNTSSSAQTSSPETFDPVG